MSFMYFIPGIKTPIQSELERLGLDKVFGRIHSGRIKCPPRCAVDDNNSPSSGPGLLIGATAAPSCQSPVASSQVAFNPDSQTWRPATKEAEYYIGFDTASGPPTPESLQRDELCMGRWLTLGDGQNWMIPIAAYIPKRRISNADGELQQIVMDRFAELADVATEITDKYNELAEHRMELVSSSDLMATFDELAKSLGIMTSAREREVLTVIIQANYRINQVGIDLLGLFDDSCQEKILRTLIDWDSAMELYMAAFAEGKEEKKKPPEPSASTSTKTPTESSQEAAER